MCLNDYTVAVAGKVGVFVFAVLILTLCTTAAHDTDNGEKILLLIDKDSSSASQKHKHGEKSTGESLFHVLLAEISPFKLTDSNLEAHSTTTVDFNANLKELIVPTVEFEKLKTAARNAGLSESKANRVQRAAEVLNLGYSDIAELRKLYNDPTTSAEYGDWMRKSLERRCITEEYQRDLKMSTIPAGIQITPDEYQRLKTAAKLSGLEAVEIEELAKTLQKSKLSKDQLTKLEEAIVHHGPTAMDLTKLIEYLDKVKKTRDISKEEERDGEDEDEDETNPNRYGADWLYRSTNVNQ